MKIKKVRREGREIVSRSSFFGYEARVEVRGSAIEARKSTIDREWRASKTTFHLPPRGVS
jgi:hypothetical protein